MTEEEMIERGKELCNQCYAGALPLPPNIEPNNYWGASMKMFNDYWGDERLSFRDKRLLVFGVLAAQGADPGTFEIHARSALKNGEINAEELRSVVMMLIPYTGLAQTSRLWMVTEKVIAEASAA